MEIVTKEVSVENFYLMLNKLSKEELAKLFKIVSAFYNNQDLQKEKKLKPIFPKCYPGEDGLPVWDMGFTGEFNREDCYEK